MLREGVDVAHELVWLYGFSAKPVDAERGRGARAVETY